MFTLTGPNLGFVEYSGFAHVCQLPNPKATHWAIRLAPLRGNLRRLPANIEFTQSESGPDYLRIVAFYNGVWRHHPP